MVARVRGITVGQVSGVRDLKGVLDQTVQRAIVKYYKDNVAGEDADLGQTKVLDLGREATVEKVLPTLNGCKRKS